MVEKIRGWPLSARLTVALLLALALVGTGIASLAVLSDELVVTSTFASATVDLKASNDGNTFTDSLTLTWPLGVNGTPYDAVFPVTLKNDGNVQLSWTATSTAVFSPTGTNGWKGLTMIAMERTTIAACIPGSSSQQINDFNAPAVEKIDGLSIGGGNPGPPRILAVGASEVICLRVSGTPTFAPDDGVIQTLTFHAINTGL